MKLKPTAVGWIALITIVASCVACAQEEPLNVVTEPIAEGASTCPLDGVPEID